MARTLTEAARIAGRMRPHHWVGATIDLAGAVLIAQQLASRLGG